MQSIESIDEKNKTAQSNLDLNLQDGTDKKSPHL
jgi:hypothetical protein